MSFALFFDTIAEDGLCQEKIFSRTHGADTGNDLTPTVTLPVTLREEKFARDMMEAY